MITDACGTSKAIKRGLDLLLFNAYMFINQMALCSGQKNGSLLKKSWRYDQYHYVGFSTSVKP